MQSDLLTHFNVRDNPPSQTQEQSRHRRPHRNEDGQDVHPSACSISDFSEISIMHADASRRAR
jgi:hypothetical protein